MRQLVGLLLVIGLAATWVALGLAAEEGQKVQAEVLALDAFEGKLDLDWKVLGPDPSHYSLTKKPGTLTITTQRGGIAGKDTDRKNLFLIDCPKPVGKDLQVTVCLSGFRPVAEWNQAGTIFYNDDDNYLKCVYEWCGGQRVYTVGMENDGRFVRFL
jgi:hypothetical protein